MSDTASYSAGISGRYATALFELAKEAGQLDAVDADLGTLRAALDESAELRRVIASPVYAREDQTNAIRAVGEKLGLGALTANTIALMGSKRRLFVLPQMIEAVKKMIATDRGEVTADVTAAKPLTDAQTKSLTETLRAAVGQDIVINTTVDESLIGGLVVQVGSRMIDTSVRAKLNALQNTLKEVG
ncbi:MAG: F0F1 ATP synthase subunit delta [Pseudomonadota bacterium]